MTFENVCVVGLGYIGLPTAAILAHKGFKVMGVDVSVHAIESIRAGSPHIHEPDLDILVSSAVGSGRLQVSCKPDFANVFIIAVPTPFDKERHPDLSHVKSAAASVAPFLVPGNLVILESTSPPGTTEQMKEWIESSHPGRSEGVLFAHCPERVLPGRILQELLDNDRIIGGLTPEASELAGEFYGTFVRGSIHLTNAKTAELCKLAENAYRDTNIAFANELSMICDTLDVDVWKLIKLANRHPRVNILEPGPGVGGHCIAVDPWFIVDSAPETSRLIRCARQVNDSKPDWVVRKVKQAAINLEAPVIACLGLAFKPDVDDLRESPSIEIVRALSEDERLTLLVCEPYIHRLPPSLEERSNIRLVSTEEAISRSSHILFLVAHRQFLTLERATLEGKIVIDTKGCIS